MQPNLAGQKVKAWIMNRQKTRAIINAKVYQQITKRIMILKMLTCIPILLLITEMEIQKGNKRNSKMVQSPILQKVKEKRRKGRTRTRKRKKLNLNSKMDLKKVKRKAKNN